MTERNFKWLSFLVSLVLVGLLTVIWAQMNRYDPEHLQLVNQAAVDTFLKANWESKLPPDTEPTIHIKTGIFIQSLKFFDSSEVNVTGYIWQHYQDGVNDSLKPGPAEVGFVLPEQVNSGSDITPREVYRIRRGDEEVIGWYFEATLRQPFEYSTYPFDHKTVWVRMWPKDFSRNVVLVPDLESYDATGTKDIFGIDATMVMGPWQRTDTFFDYQLGSFDTNFGIENYVGKSKFPELRYNFVICRRFGDAFIVHLLPLLMVVALLFGTLLTITEDPDLSSRFGFSASGVMGSCSALFFVVLLAHMQLRDQFAGSSVVYIEYFYFLMYILLVTGAAYAYLFAAKRARWCLFIHDRDSLALKVGFWPLVLVCMIGISLAVLLRHSDI